MSSNPERERLAGERHLSPGWAAWGPYLSERQWGTVREDYSEGGHAWEYFPHDHARSRVYRWGEDGLLGICEAKQRLCLALACWNGKDSILKERLFGLTNSEGNHGEDVKELYYYVDATPTHSYLKGIYKYPQQAFPYKDLVDTNKARSRKDPEYELLDTGIFNEDRYFDIEVEYAKVSPTDLLMRITAHNRGPEAAPLHLVPHLWSRNNWSWKEEQPKPSLEREGPRLVKAAHPEIGGYFLHAEEGTELLFCDNETNVRRFHGTAKEGYFKDGIHEYVVEGKAGSVNPEGRGTKCGVLKKFEVPAGGSARMLLRLADVRHGEPFADADAIFGRRKEEADLFYASLQGNLSCPDAKMVQRQAWGGMIWTKQFYRYDMRRWHEGDPTEPKPPEARKRGRNVEWGHLNNSDVISMPDKWEYPWYAAWDLAFHAIALAPLDSQFAKDQLVLVTREWYMHPNGQLPAYEWSFSDVNPPVHALATWRVFQIDREQNGGKSDLGFLERIFHKLLLNFTWWVNRKDEEGRNVFQGGFLGLDNIGVFDRSKPLPTGGYINQADGTSWMAMYCLNMMRMALELAQHNHAYEDVATKFFEHFLLIAEALNNIGEQGIGLWDEEDGFYYDELALPDGRMIPLKVRSMVGLIPLFAVEVLDHELLERVPEFSERLNWILEHRPELAKLVSRWQEPGKGEVRLLSLLRGHRMKCLLRRALDESEFLSEYGVRALSRYHQDRPYRFDCGDQDLEVAYEPGESTSNLFGGNSNWRGPIWMPVNMLIILSMRKFQLYYGDDFKIECPTGSGKFMTLVEASDEIGRRLTRLFIKDENGQRAIYNGYEKMQNDPHFRDLVLFYEYFHAETGRGMGASHQTGWTGMVANMWMNNCGLAVEDNRKAAGRDSRRRSYSG